MATEPDNQHLTPGPDKPPSPGKASKRPPNITVPPPKTTSGEDLPKHGNDKDRLEPQEVELGIYLQASFSDAGSPRSRCGSVSSAGQRFSPSFVSATFGRGTESFFLSNSQWHTDIVTFCSHARIDSVLGRARITHIQARKSRRPPFLHEYLLVFFTAAQGQRFVVRVDRLGKIGSSSGGLLGWCAGQRGVAANTAIQQVGVFHRQDTSTDLDTLDGPWFAYDGRWGSYPVATLVTWENARDANGQVSHHVQTASTQSGPSPRLSDVSRLLEAILLEMPTYHLMTTNCYFMTRTSLLLLQRCFPTSFACYLGAASGELVPPSELAEPVWAGLLRWYLPFVIMVLAIYFPTVVFTQIMLAGTAPGPMAPIPEALHISVHAIIDVPLPVGLLHAWITSLEVRMNDLVMRISSEYRQLLARENPDCAPPTNQQPFGAPFAKPWHAFALWCLLGATCTVVFFVVLILKPMGVFIMFLFMLVFSVTFNCKFFNSDILEDPFAVDPASGDTPFHGDLPAISDNDVIFGT